MDLRLKERGVLAADQLEALGPKLDRLEAGLALAEAFPRFLLAGGTAPEGSPTLETMARWRTEAFGLPLAGADPVRREVYDRLCAMFEGVMAAPIAVTLARERMFSIRGRGRDTEVAEHLKIADSLSATTHRRIRSQVFPAMAALGWLDPGTERLTRAGMLTGFFATAYGVTSSYLPLLRRAEELIFKQGNFAEMFSPTTDGHETHVDRLMNIWGSGGAHDLYFRTVDQVVQSLFERADYPLAICDTGCGDGSFLRHLYEILRDRMSWRFFDRPVYFIGSDLNLRSRERTRETLAQAGVPQAHVVEADIDINDPHVLDAGIRRLGIEIVDRKSGAKRLLTAADALHTNSMLIHNRSFRLPAGATIASSTDGAFVDSNGYAAVGDVLQANLVEFMRRWAPLVGGYGWLFIELHTVAAELVAEDPGRSPTIAYDITHGFSHQYTVERSELLAAAALAGLQLGPADYQAEFPSGDLNRISVTYLVAGG
jgi:hypothetical protein